MSGLKVERLHKDYGGLTALMDVTLDVKPGERRAIIGPNGAGKTTLFKLIAGEVAPTSGRVHFDGRDITGLPVHARANLGLGHTFQRNNLFFDLTVFENVRLAVQHHQGAAARWFRPASRFRSVNEETEAILGRLGLTDQRHQLARNLAYGQQRALEVAVHDISIARFEVAAQSLPQNIRDAVGERIREYMASEQPAAVRRKRFRREDWQKRPAA